MSITISSEVKTDILDKVVDKGMTVEVVATYLFAMGYYKTKADGRKAVEQVLKDEDLTPKKKVPMSEQLKAWFHAQPDPLKVTKDELQKQIELIGMSGGSIGWYVRVYQEAQEIAKKVIDEQFGEEVEVEQVED